MKDTNDIILENNKEYLIAHKKSGQLSQKSEKGDDSVQNQIEAYRKTALHILTRLDRPVSGLVVFSKSSSFTTHFLDLQTKSAVTKTYVAIVEGQMDAKGGTLVSHLVHDKKNQKARVSQTATDKTREATLDYKTIKALDKYTIVELSLTSGKFHQIRVQLSDHGHPIKGDVKYGARRGNKDRSIHLHARKLAFKDLHKKEQTYIANFPSDDSLWNLAAEAYSDSEN